MRLIVLGSGMDASQISGIPNRFPPGFLLEWGSERLLLECPEAVRFRLEDVGVDYASIKYLVISHSHPDHYALPQYLQSVWNKFYLTGKRYDNYSLQIYGPKTLTRRVVELLGFYRPESKNFLPLTPPVLKSLPQNAPIIIKGLKLSAKKVYHGSGLLDSLSYRFEYKNKIIAYSGDTGDCKNVYKISLNADIFLCECSARIGDEQSSKTTGHLNPKQAGEIAKKSQVKKLVLFHYSGLDSNSAITKDCRKSGYAGEIIVAQDFQVIE